MDRISFSTPTTTPTPAPTSAVRPPQQRLIDPAPRLRLADREDRVELSSSGPKAAAQPKNVDRLVAARVTRPVSPPEIAAPQTAASHAIKFYTNPSDQNAAATLGASGTSLDVMA